MAKGDGKNNMENALSHFAKILTEDKDNVGALAAISVAFQVI